MVVWCMVHVLDINLDAAHQHTHHTPVVSSQRLTAHALQAGLTLQQLQLLQRWMPEVAVSFWYRRFPCWHDLPGSCMCCSPVYVCAPRGLCLSTRTCSKFLLSVR